MRNITSKNLPILTDFSQATLWLGIVTIIVIPPFSIANLLKGHYILSLICFSFMVLLVAQCIMIRKQRYNLLFSLVALVPALTAYIFFQIYTHGIVGVFWSFPASMVLFFILPLRYAIRSSILLLSINLPLIYYKLDVAIASSISLALICLAVLSSRILAMIEKQQQDLQFELQQKRADIEHIAAHIQPVITGISSKVERIQTQSTEKRSSELAGLSENIEQLNLIVDNLDKQQSGTVCYSEKGR